MPSPFFVDPAMGYDSQALSGLGQALGANRIERQKVEQAKQAEANKLAMQSEVTEAMQSRDPEKVREVSVKYPEFSTMLYKELGIDSDQQKADATSFTRDILTANPASIDQKYRDRIQYLRDNGRDPAHTEASYSDWLANPESEMKDLEVLYAGLDEKGYGALKDIRSKPETKLGTGAMSGYTFTDEEGYQIDPAIQAKLASDAEIKAAKPGMLSSKDIAGVNDKVTSLTQDATKIHNAAKSLTKLNESSSATDQLAAVFMFMKSLDPTSVVREGEQQMAQSTGGPADALVGYVNSLQGEGRLTDTAFRNMVNTAITLSNSASDSSGSQLSGYLDVLSDKIPATDIAKMRARVSGRLEPLADIQSLSDDDLAAQLKAARAAQGRKP